MTIDTRSRIHNFKNIELVDPDLKEIRLEIVVIADQDYKKFELIDKPSCEDKRKVATQIMNTIVPIGGDWSDEYEHIENKASSSIFTLKRPRLYYFEILDCKGEVRNAFKPK